MKKRISKDDMYTQFASLMAQRGTCGRLQVGAIITKDGRIVATGYNGALKGQQKCSDICNVQEPCKRAVHAEANAIAFSARTGTSLEGTTIYITHSPCIDCSRLIHQAGIKRVVYLENFRDESGINQLILLGIEVVKYEKTNPQV